jgi:hypothetical protein
VRCPECTCNVPLAHFTAATWAAATPVYADCCAVCQEKAREYWAEQLAGYFEQLVAHGGLAA